MLLRFGTVSPAENSWVLLKLQTMPKANWPSIDPRVDSARRGLFLAKNRYHQDPSEEKRKEVATKKDLLKACYNEVEEKILKDKFKIVEDTADRYM